MSNSNTKKSILPKIECNIEEVSILLNYNYDIYFAMSKEELFEKIWKLRQYCVFLKAEYNESCAKAKWCYGTMMKVAKPLATNYSSYDKDERIQCAIRENANLASLQEKKIAYDYDASILDGVEKAVYYLISILEKLLDYKIERDRNERNRENS